MNWKKIKKEMMADAPKMFFYMAAFMGIYCSIMYAIEPGLF